LEKLPSGEKDQGQKSASSDAKKKRPEEEKVKPPSFCLEAARKEKGWYCVARNAVGGPGRPKTNPINGGGSQERHGARREKWPGRRITGGQNLGGQEKKKPKK